MTRKVKLVSSTVLDSPAKNEVAVQQFLDSAAGPLTSTGGDVVCTRSPLCHDRVKRLTSNPAWEKVPRRLVSNTSAAALSTVSEDWPDFEFLTQSSYPGPKPPDRDDYAGITVVIVNTFSRGNVTISSSSMLDAPLVSVNFLTHPIDKETAVAAVRRAREIFAHPLLGAVVYGPEVAPGNGTSTDDQISKYIQSSARTISHVSCTCKMGKQEDPMAVVDSKGNVFGLEKLRVVDASAMPFLPPGHPVATVYALAELIAEDILARNSNESQRNRSGLGW